MCSSPYSSASASCGDCACFRQISGKRRALLWWGCGVADVPGFGVHPICTLRHPRGGWLVSTRGIPVEETPPSQTPQSQTPPSQTPPSTDTYGFDPFAQHPFYAGINHSLVRRAIARLDATQPKGELVRVVDLASGTGAVTQLIVDELERLGRPATALGIEPATEALGAARERLQGRGARGVA